MKPRVSVIIPMFNEEENVESTLEAVGGVLRQAGWSDYELVPVNDGSVDGTADRLRAMAATSERVHPVIYTANRGRGHALRRGFAAANGEYLVSMDADLSYSPDYIPGMLKILEDTPSVDVVIGSDLMPGGGMEGVPPVREAVSRVGNVILRNSLQQKVYKSTGVFRAYRAEVLRSLPLEADGKEIHLEILSKALASGYVVIETPVVLKARSRGRSKFNFGPTAITHLLFAALERPAVLFGLFGGLLALAGIALAGFLLNEYLSGTLNPDRPLMTAMIILFLGGLMAGAFALIASLMLSLRRDIVRLHRDVLRLVGPVDPLGEADSGPDRP